MKRKIKLLITISMFTKNGGSNAVCVNMLNSLDYSKYDVTLCVIIDVGFTPKLPKEVKIIYLVKVKYGTNVAMKQKSTKGELLKKVYYVFNRFSPINLLYNIKTKGEYDLEIAYDYGLQYKLVAKSPRICRKIGWAQVDIAQEPKAYAYCKDQKEFRNLLMAFDKFIFNATDSMQSFINIYGYKDKCKTLYNIVPFSNVIDASKETIEEESEFRPLLVTVGRLVYQKGYDRLLEIINKLVKEGYSFETWIIGDGEEENNLKTYINEHNLKKYVKLLGFQSNPYKYMVKGDWFIAPSRYEGMSTVVACAYILGIPVMTSDCAGMTELTDNGQAGVMVPNTDEGIEGGMRKILDMDFDEHKKYAELSVNRKKWFSVEERMKAIDQTFLDVLRTKRTGEK